jgi:hypothetical protein
MTLGARYTAPVCLREFLKLYVLLEREHMAFPWERSGKALKCHLYRYN